MSEQTPLMRYHALIAQGELQPDEGQSQVVEALDALYLELMRPKNSQSLWQRLTQSAKAPEAISGLYIHGGVGRGKSRLMDMFHDCLPDGSSVRVHFHDFMVMAHDAMNEARQAGAADPIVAGAKALMAQQASLKQNAARLILCFDEMEVRDIADAMIIKRLFDALFAMHIIVVATSNRHPEALYENGLHRDRFIPFINQLMAHCRVLKIADGNDWRARLLGTNPRWYVAADGTADETAQQMASLFATVTSDAEPEAVCVKVAGRDIIFDKVAHNIAFVSFDALCAVPLAARDYVAIADRLTGLFITDIPTLGNDQQNEARRFMWLIDALYDRGRFVVANAQDEMTKLYQGEVWAFEFERTLSRLQEMTRLGD